MSITEAAAARFIQRCSPLTKAAMANDLDKVKSLVENGSNVNEKDGNGETALIAWISNKGKKETRTEGIKYLLEKGADPNFVTGCGDTLLTYAISSCEVDDVRILLENKVTDVNATDRHGNTALILACEIHSFEMAEILLEHGANPNLTNNEGMSALCVVHCLWCPEIVDLLNSFGAVPTSFVLSKEVDMSIMQAVWEGNVDKIREMLAQGMDPDIEFDGRLLIHTAAETGNLEMVKLLVENGASLERCNIFGETPLFVAMNCYQEEVAAYLRDQGAEE